MTDAELAELLRTVIARPDDHEVLAVYGDVLIERGDPRGELINLQLRPRTPEVITRERELIAQLDAGIVAQFGHPNTVLSWKRGFIEAVDFAPHVERRSLVEALRMLGVMPAARQLRRIVIRFLAPGWGPMGPIISALTRVAPQLRSLRELVFTAGHRSEDDTTPATAATNFSDLSPLLRAVPKLEVLEITHTDYSTLRDVDAPSLKRLVLEAPLSYDIGRLANMRLPSLEELEIYKGSWGASDVEGVLARTLPLRHLFLECWRPEEMQRLCQIVPAAPLVRGVRTLSLVGTPFDKTCVEYIEHHAARLRQLQRFEIDETKQLGRIAKALGDIVVTR